MIGPGTGIAPFRSFLHERRALNHTGRNWLFFGERSAATDFLYRDELESMQSDGHLTRLDLAFSRDQDHKIYVQDRMLERASRILQLAPRRSQCLCLRGCLSNGEGRRCHSPHHCPAHTASCCRNREPNTSSELKDQHRYHRDVY